MAMMNRFKEKFREDRYTILSAEGLMDSPKS